MTTNKAGKFQSVLNTRALWIDDHALRGGDIVNDATTIAGATIKAALTTIGTLITATASSVQTLTNKSLVDSSTFLINAVDNTKRVKFDLATLTTGTTYTWFPPPQSAVYLLHGYFNNGNQLSAGYNSLANGANATAFGANSSASATNSGAFGNAAVASASEAHAFGMSTSAPYVGSTVAGYTAFANGPRASTFGRAATAGQDSIAMGYNSSAFTTNSVALGMGAVADSGGDVAIGKSATTTSANQLAIRLGNSSVTELKTSLVTDATARATLVTHLPVTLNGVTYYIKLYQT